MGILSTQVGTALEDIEKGDGWQSAAAKIREAIVTLALKVEDLEQRLTVLEEEPPDPG